jgi:hypothetical protein
MSNWNDSNKEERQKAKVKRHEKRMLIFKNLLKNYKV